MSAAASPSPEKVLRRMFWKLLFRGRAAQQMQSHRTKKQISMGATLLFYALFGLVPCMMAFTMDALTFASLLHGFTFMLASLTLATSSGTMLFMKEEAEILLHRPVTPQQLLRAKAFVLVAFALTLAFSLNLAGLIVGMWSKGSSWRFFPAHVLTTVLLMMFSTGCIVLVYNLCLKWFGRDKLDNLLTTLQTIVSVLMMVSSQLLPRVMGSEAMHHFTAVKGWALALPPVWFGALDALLSGASPWSVVAWPASLAVFSTAAALWLGFGKLSAAYGEGLMALNESSSSVNSTDSKPKNRWLPKLLQASPFRWWLRDPVERHAFLLTSAYMARDREIKLKLYPGIAPMLIMPVVMLFGMSGLKGSSAATWVQCFAACYLAIIPLQAMMLLHRSEHWRAASFFQTSPLPHWAQLFHGARKAVLAWLTYPILILQAVAFCLLQHSLLPLVMILPALIFLPAFSLVPALTGTWIPFSLPPEEQRDAGTGCLFMAIVMTVSASVGGLAMWMWNLGPFWFSGFTVVEAIAVTVSYSLMNRTIKSREWKTSETE